MIDKEKSKEKIKELVEQFTFASKNKDYINGKNEEWIKWNFIEPLLEEVLGWEKSDIEKEKRVLKDRADYMLKIGNEEVLVIEAKRASVNLSEDEGRQAVSYAYHRKVKFAIVTNFREIKVYHALSNIRNIDNNLLKLDSGKAFILNFDKLIDNIDSLFLLSKESFEKREINKLLSKKDEKLATPIDKSVLDDLLHSRDLLSKDLKKVKMHLTKEQIDEIVQILMVRLIFMRSVEDRGLEPKNFLLGIIEDVKKGRTNKNLWARLREEFSMFDKNYNSKLFAEGLLEKEGFFDEQTLIDVIRALYFGIKNTQQRYMFDEIPGDLLGSIYEQYLGTILQGTEKRVKLESGSGKRKKMGIYYTPSYIVDYIIKNTVGEYIKDKSIDDILKVKILDPACGSGSFIVRAFQEVCKAIEDRLKKGEKSKSVSFQSYKEALNLSQKITILTNCIYGIDLDEKAVELAQLNLLLKLLEDETPESHKRLLPNLKENIKCGNSLIDDYSVAGDKAFKWEAQFPEAFKNGGFDVVVGNPPYIRNTELEKKDKKSFIKIYGAAYQQFDIYVLFFEKAIDILKNGGQIGFITPNKFLASEYALKLRDLMLRSTKISLVLDVSNIDIFKDASTYPAITILQKEQNSSVIRDNLISFRKANNEKEIYSNTQKKIEQSKFTGKDNRFLEDKGNNIADIVTKIEKDNKRIAELFMCQRGSPKNKIKIIEKLTKESLPCIISKEVDRYYFSVSNNQFVISGLQDKIISKEKILMPRTVLSLKASYIAGNDFIMDRIYYLIPKENFNLKFVLALLNSRLIDFYYKINFSTTHVGGGYLDLRGTQISQIPIKFSDRKSEQRMIDLVEKMIELQKKSHKADLSGNEKERLEQQIKNIDYEIDQEVYKLYGITKEEQKIIEESLK